MVQTTANYNMVTIGRELRGFTQHELSHHIDVSQALISKIEMGILPVSIDILEKLSKGLSLPKSFFLREGQKYQPNLHYRKKKKLNRKVLTQAAAEMNIHRLNVQRLLNSIDLESDIPTLSVEEYGHPEEIARAVRSYWRLPRGPVVQLFGLLESKGMMILMCNFESEDIDGRSMFTDEKHVIVFLNRNMPMDRLRFTVAHELAHVVMHLFTIVEDTRDIEKEANQFAAEFLMPAEEIKPQLMGRMSLTKLSDMKRYWRVAMSAILVRAKNLGVISNDQYRNMWMKFGKLGFKKQEPAELEPSKENPVLLNKILETFAHELDYTKEDFANLFTMHIEEIEEKYFSKATQHKFKVFVNR